MGYKHNEMGNQFGCIQCYSKEKNQIKETKLLFLSYPY